MPTQRTLGKECHCNMADAQRDNAGDILTLLESEREARRLR